MKANKSIYAIMLAALLTGCSLDQNPISDPSELTEGVPTDDNTAVLRDRQAAQNQLKNLYEKLKNRQEHWSLDMLLIGDAHSDNAYAGTTGAEVVPFETNSIDGSNTVLQRDWERYLEDIAHSNLLISLSSRPLRSLGGLSEERIISPNTDPSNVTFILKERDIVARSILSFRSAI